MKLKPTFLIAFLSSACAISTVFIYLQFSVTQPPVITSRDPMPVAYAHYQYSPEDPAAVVDFTKAAAASVPAVVHIRTRTPSKRAVSNGGINDLMKEFFGPGFEPGMSPEQRASGSGVIMSEDGYIITNYHVISDKNGRMAPEINVTLNSRKTYTAKVIGRDLENDIAVLKINATRLPHLLFGNSNLIETGQWVLAVGYPLTLEATVTAGIISATGRNLATTRRAVREGDTTGRSFIQTDAALNTGNSGGALINTEGELIGINTGIVSPTGTYAGYSFAIPVNTVKKAVKGIIESSGIQKGS